MSKAKKKINRALTQTSRLDGWHCTCQHYNKNRERRQYRHQKFHPTTVDAEGICTLCDHYAVENPIINTNPSKRVTDSMLNEKRYMLDRARELGDFFLGHGVFAYNKTEAYNE